MNTFTMTKNNRTVTYTDAAALLVAIETIIDFGDPALVAIPRGATKVLRGVSDLLERHGVQVVVTEDSEPEAVDYLLNGVLGGVIGTGGGAVLGSYALVLAARFGWYVPYVGVVVGTAAVAGLAVGAMGGLYVTRMGLRLRFAPSEPNTIHMELLPA